MTNCVKCGNHCVENSLVCDDCSWPLTLEGWQITSFQVKLVTLDTCCVNAKQNESHLNKLEEWAAQNLIIIERSETFMRELMNPEHIKKALTFIKQPHVFKLNSSIIGGGDVLGGPDMSKEIRKILFPTTRDLTPNQECDIEHLKNHVEKGRDVLVTLNTNDFINRGKQDQLANLGIWVFTPEGLVHFLQQQYGWV